MKSNKSILKKVGIVGLACMVATSTISAATILTYAEDGTELEQETTRCVQLYNDGNGRITLNGQDGNIKGLVDGQTYSFVITANEGYELDKVIEASAGDVTGYVQDGVLNYMIPWTDLNFTATFKKIEEETPDVRHVKLHSDGNGQITLNGIDGDLTNLVDGETYNFVITANEGYELDKVIEASAGDVTEYVQDGVLSYMIPWTDLDFMATFKKIEEETPDVRHVKLHSDGNGQITLDGIDGDLTNLVDGETYNFVITANEGYELDKVIEASAGDVTEYVQDGVLSYKIPWADLDFTATFKKIEEETPDVRHVKLHSDGNGQITLDGIDGDITGLVDGQTYKFIITAYDGYELDKVIEAKAGDVTQYVKNGALEYMIPWDDLDFMVSFKKIETGVKEQYKFGLNNDGNGLLTYGTEDGDHFFKEGTYTFTVKANEGYELDKIYNQDGVDVTADINLDGNGNFEWRVAYDGYLTATFKEVRHHNGYRWGLQSDGNGVVRCDELGYDGGEKFVEENEYTFAVIPNEGYKLDKLYLLTEGTEADVTADAKIAEDGTFTWTVAYDGTLKAVFAKIEPVVEPETPVVEPETPVVEPETPVVEPETPVVEPETPVVEPETPVVKPETPEKPEEPQIKPDNKTNSTDKNTKQTTVDKKVDNTPKTGDTTPIAAVAFISVIALAAAVAAFLSFYLRREK